jgi:hypothetical protein
MTFLGRRQSFCATNRYSTLNSEVISHLASFVTPAETDSGGVLMGALTIACDASGHKNSPALVVAGFLSSVNDWKSFAAQWSERLQIDGIEYFHAVDTAEFRGPFRHWQDKSDRVALREALFQDLMDIIKSHVYRFCGCAVLNKTLNEMSKDLRHKFRLGAFALAGLSCEKQIRRYLLSEWANCATSVEMIFEDGDEGFGDLKQWLSSAKGTLPIVRAPKKNTIQKDGS